MPRSTARSVRSSSQSISNSAKDRVAGWPKRGRCAAGRLGDEFDSMRERRPAIPLRLLVSQTVRDLVAGSGLTFEDTGDHELKGLPDRWRLYRVVNPPV
jgi:hypothetical protein